MEMELSKSAQGREKFLQSTTTSAFMLIFFIVGMAMVGAGTGSGAWAVGIAAAAGCASVAYIAKLVISVRMKDCE